MLRVAVIANTKQHFDRFIREVHPMQREMFVYIVDTKGARGRRFDEVIIVGPPLYEYKQELFIEMQSRIFVRRSA